LRSDCRCAIDVECSDRVNRPLLRCGLVIVCTSREGLRPPHPRFDKLTAGEPLSREGRGE
jgi:hypothetical protein